jgi:hypothetical protein
MIKFFFGIEETIRRISRAFGARVFLTFLARRASKVANWNVKTFLDLILVSFGNTHLPDGLVCVLGSRTGKRIYIWKDPANELAGYPYYVPNGTD